MSNLISFTIICTGYTAYKYIGWACNQFTFCTYHIHACNKGFLGKQSVTHMVRSLLLLNRKVQYRVCKSKPPHRIRNQTNPVHSHFVSLRYILQFPFYLCLDFFNSHLPHEKYTLVKLNFLYFIHLII
jgi:hypothetical protein